MLTRSPSKKPARRGPGRKRPHARRSKPFRGPSRRSSNNNNAMMAAAVVVPTSLFALAGYGVITLMDGEERDANFCYTRDDQYQAVIFVDNSLEGESGSQLRDYRTGLMQVWDNAPANTLIRIASTNRTQGGSFAQPQFTICKPAATPAEQEAIGAPEQSAPMVARVHDEARGHFEEIVETVIADATDPAKTAKDSPILEQLQAISRYSGFEGANRSLTVITDGINNSEAGRFCLERGALVPFERYQTTRRYQDIEPSSFDGLDVTFLLVEFGRFPALGAPHCTNEELRDFWPEYFSANGAASVDLRRLRYWEDS